MRNLALFGNRMIRVFDDLILRPVESTDFVPSDIKKDLKEMKKEVKQVSKQFDELIATPEVKVATDDADNGQPEVDPTADESPGGDSPDPK